MASSMRVSELPNPLTTDVDVADTAAMVRLLASSDAMLFTGYAGLPHLNATEVVAAVARTIVASSAALAHPRGRIVFSGCGTSGRLAHLFARGLNRWLDRQFGVKRNPFEYLLAGGDAALLLPQEQVEDQSNAGEADLAAWERARDISTDDPVVVIGISCGLSATYVASMLHAALARPHFTAVAMGFNPVEAVKHVRVDGWSLSFYEILRQMLGPHRHHAVVINPVAGPETIAGSSRMKGGSITKILVESIACTAAGLAFGPSGVAARTAVAADASLLHPVVQDLFLQYEVAVRHAYAQAEGMEALIDSAGASITTPVPTEAALAALAGAGSAGSRLIVSPTGFGRIVYLGVGTAGLLGLIDASECNPTYGSLFNSVRGFLAGAWATVANKQGPQSLPVPPHMRCDAHLPTGPLPEFIGLGLEAFTADFLPTVNAADTVVLTYLEEAAEDAGPAHLAEALAALDLAKAAGARVLHAVVVTAPPAGCAAGGSADVVTAIRRIAPQGVVVSLPAVRLRLSLPFSAAPSVCDAEAPVAGDVPASESIVAACGASKHQVVAFDAHGADTAAAPSCLAELCLKLVLNATTVGAHVRKGMIYHNRMINLMLTNAKLFHRAVGIVADTSGAPVEIATRSVLRAVYHSDDVIAPGGGYISVAHLQLGAPAPTATAARDRAFVTRRELEGRPFAEAAALPVSNHVHNASSQRNIVPTAIVLAVDELARQKAGMVRPLMAEAAAVAMLEKQPVVRLALLDVLKGSA